jgi:2-polyprenyl-6-methoxyphenol hydroxylase-like FAD-dependent oxidoreductase
MTAPTKGKGVYNVVVIGAGTAGLITATWAAGLGGRVALIERTKMAAIAISATIQAYQTFAELGALLIFPARNDQADHTMAPPQLEPAPAVQPKQ